jgi:hypothetical protein
VPDHVIDESDDDMEMVHNVDPEIRKRNSPDVN